MIKLIKSRLFAFVLGALIFGSIGVVSAYTIFANDIGYTPSDSTWKVDNVKDAIDELYTEANNNLSVRFGIYNNSTLSMFYVMDFKKYENFEVSEMDCANSGSGHFQISNANWTSTIDGELNKKYKTADFSQLNLYSNGNYYCVATIVFYK